MTYIYRYGWRGRIGLLVPAGNPVVDVEFSRMAPSGVSVHVDRFAASKTLSSETDEHWIEANQDAVRAAGYLSRAKVDVIVYGCTTGSYWGGNVKWNSDLTQRLKDKANVTAVTTTGACVEALKSFNAKKIVLASPYTDNHLTRERKCFEAYGFKILKSEGLSQDGHRMFTETSVETAYRQAKRIFLPEADAIFISCTGYSGAIDAVDALERDLGKPVVTSVQAAMWGALRVLNFKEPVLNYGALLREHL